MMRPSRSDPIIAGASTSAVGTHSMRAMSAAARGLGLTEAARQRRMPASPPAAVCAASPAMYAMPTVEPAAAPAMPGAPDVASMTAITAVIARPETRPAIQPSASPRTVSPSLKGKRMRASSP